MKLKERESKEVPVEFFQAEYIRYSYIYVICVRYKSVWFAMEGDASLKLKGEFGVFPQDSESHSHKRLDALGVGIQYNFARLVIDRICVSYF